MIFRIVKVVGAILLLLVVVLLLKDLSNYLRWIKLYRAQGIEY